MKCLRRRLKSALLVGGMLYSTAVLKCLPEDYFALSARSFAVGLANNLLTAVVILPIYEAIGLAPPTNGNDGTTGGTVADGG